MNRQKQKKWASKWEVCNMTALWFFLGLLLGGCIGVVVMCLFQINKCNYYESEIRRIEEQIKTKK